MGMLPPKEYDYRKDMFISFIDYQKTFDTMRRDIIIYLLRESGVDSKDNRIIRYVYWVGPVIF